MSARILVIDDDEHIRRGMASMLSRSGFEVMTADDGVAALELARTVPFDIVLVDFHLKTTTGVEVVRHFKGLYGDQVYCAVLSGEDDDATREVCIDAGADDVMAKPVAPSELRRRLTAVVSVLRIGNLAVG